MNGRHSRSPVYPRVRIHQDAVMTTLQQEGMDDPTVPDVVAEVVCAVNRRLHAAVLYDWFTLHTVKNDHIVATCERDGTTAILHTGGFSSFFEQAQGFVAGIYTLGFETETLAADYLSAGETIAHRATNVAALSALSATATTITKAAESRAKTMGVGVSPPVSPGSVRGWSFTTQRELCTLFPLDRIGIHMEENNFLHPMNTLTVLVAVGSGFSDATVGTPCTLCQMGAKCTFSCINKEIAQTVHAA